MIMPIMRCKISTCRAIFVPTDDLLLDFADGRFECTPCPTCRRVHRGSELAHAPSGDALYWIGDNLLTLRAPVASSTFESLLELAKLVQIPAERVAMCEGTGGSLMIAGRRFSDPWNAALRLNRIMKNTLELGCLMRYCRGTIDESHEFEVRMGCGDRVRYQTAHACSNPACGRVYFLGGLDGDEPTPVMHSDGSAVFVVRGNLVDVAPLKEDHGWGTVEATADLVGYPIQKTSNEEFRTMARRRYREDDDARRRAIRYLNQLMACQT